MATLIKFIISPKEFNPVPMMHLSLCLFVDNLFRKLIFSATEINWAWPVLPNIAAP